MVKKGIVLVHKVSLKGIEVDKAKIKVIEKLPPPVSVKGVRGFLGHARFYRRFIEDFLKIASPLDKEAKFKFGTDKQKLFEELKKRLTEAPILIAPDWGLPFKLMCDASDVAVGVVLGKCKEKVFHFIYFYSKVLDATQINYIVIEKVILAVVYAFDKFRAYLVGTKVIMHTNHITIRYLLNKKMQIIS